MAKIRLSPFVSVIPVGSGVLIRGDLKSIALSGKSVDEFLRRALPLLDGRHDAADIVKALPAYSGHRIRAFLADLERVGVVETAEQFPTPSKDTRREELSAFLNAWGPDRRSMLSAFAGAHVAILGSNGWSAVACQELVRSGVGRLTVIGVPGTGRRPRGTYATPAQLVRQLRRVRSQTALAHRVLKVKGGALEWPFDDVALLVVTATADELPLFAAVARMAEKRRLRYMMAHVDGLSATLGPAVVPGETACWECFRSAGWRINRTSRRARSCRRVS